MKKTACAISTVTLVTILLAPSSADAQYYGYGGYRSVYASPYVTTTPYAYASQSAYGSPYAGSWAYYGYPSGYNIGDNMMDRYPQR